MSIHTQLFERAAQCIPGGVNSPVRAFKSVGGTPVFMQEAKGAYLLDVNQQSYIDYINSWGPMILGHSHPQVVEAVQKQATKAFSFGAPTELEIEMAELIKAMAPNIDKVRLVNSGTEACMSALRLARGFTGRNKLLKFEGCYHGHADPFLVKAGSGVATFNIQAVPGISATTAEDTLVAAYNNLPEVEALFEANPNTIAAVFVEPIAGNMGCVLPQEGFLEGLRKLCTQYGALLVFDEVMTGFRLAGGGAQESLGIAADLVCYGKVIGGGMPIGAFAGREEIMNYIAPAGKVYQAGTLSGNPMAVTAGLSTLGILHQHPEIYTRIEQKTKTLVRGFEEVFNAKGIDHQINHYGSMMSIFFGAHEVQNFEDASRSNISQFNQFFHHMLTKGVYLPPSAYETWFICDALSDADINKTLEAAELF